MLAKGATTVKKAKKQQNPSLDVEGLPWPLSVPWSGSFLLSSKPCRDYIAHGVFSDMEVMIVSMYRWKMIESSADISELRDEMVGLLQKFYPDFRFADGIETWDGFKDEEFQDLNTLLYDERLSASYLMYNSQVQEIIKFCAKQPVMLADPSGEKDSARVRAAFREFISVSFLYLRVLT